MVEEGEPARQWLDLPDDVFHTQKLVRPLLIELDCLREDHPWRPRFGVFCNRSCVRASEGPAWPLARKRVESVLGDRDRLLIRRAHGLRLSTPVDRASENRHRPDLDAANVRGDLGGHADVHVLEDGDVADGNVDEAVLNLRCCGARYSGTKQ